MKDYDTNGESAARAASAGDEEAKTRDSGPYKESGRPQFNSTLLAVGVGIVLLGCLLFLEKLPDFDFGGVKPRRLWPIIIVAVGVAKLVEQKCRHLSGWVITLVGSLLIWHSVSGQPLGGLIGPAILICVGVFMVLHARRRRVVRTFVEGAMLDVALRAREKCQRDGPPKGARSEGEFAYGTAILSSYKYKPKGGEFCGGDVTAIFGGFEMDLSRMTMKSDTARVEVFAMFGGGEIRVPEGWDVAVRVSAFAGGVEDKTISPPSLQGQPPKLLIISGSALLGGVTVKTCPCK